LSWKQFKETNTSELIATTSAIITPSTTSTTTITLKAKILKENR